MTQTHAPSHSVSVWDMRANDFELKLWNILSWARQQRAEAESRSIDLPATAALPGIVALAYDRRLPLQGGDSAFDLTDMPDELAAPLREYVEEMVGRDPALPVDRQFSNRALDLHSFALMSARPRLEERLA